jgi:hypothetical protein
MGSSRGGAAFAPPVDVSLGPAPELHPVKHANHRNQRARVMPRLSTRLTKTTRAHARRSVVWLDHDKAGLEALLRNLPRHNIRAVLPLTGRDTAAGCPLRADPRRRLYGISPTSRPPRWEAQIRRRAIRARLRLESAIAVRRLATSDGLSRRARRRSQPRSQSG